MQIQLQPQSHVHVDQLLTEFTEYKFRRQTSHVYCYNHDVARPKHCSCKFQWSSKVSRGSSPVAPDGLWTEHGWWLLDPLSTLLHMSSEEKWVKCISYFCSCYGLLFDNQCPKTVAIMKPAFSSQSESSSSREPVVTKDPLKELSTVGYIRERTLSSWIKQRNRAIHLKGGLRPLSWQALQAFIYSPSHLFFDMPPQTI